MSRRKERGKRVINPEKHDNKQKKMCKDAKGQVLIKANTMPGVTRYVNKEYKKRAQHYSMF